MSNTQDVNQLAIISVAQAQAGKLIKQLTQHDYYVTHIDSMRGMLYEPTASLLIGLDSERLPQLITLIRQYCQTKHQYVPIHTESPMLEMHPVMIETESGGATIYTLSVERFEQL